MGAVGELAVAEIRRKLRESVLQPLFVYQLHPFGVERGEARRVGDEGIRAEGIQLNMARGMAPAAKLFRDLADRQLQCRADAVEKARLSNAGIAGQARELPGQKRLQLPDPLARCSARNKDRDPGLFVDLRQRLCRGQIVLVDADHGRDVLQLCNGKHAVNEKRLRDRDGAGGQHDQLVDIRDRRADKRVFARQQRFEYAPAAFLLCDADKVPDERRLLLPPEAAAGLALDHAVFRLHIIEAADGFDDPVSFHISHPNEMSCES